MNRLYHGFRAIFLLFFLILCPLFATQAASVRVIPLTGTIDGTQVALVQRGLREAKENGDTAVVLTINSLGGSMDQALKIRELLKNAELPTLAYVTSRAWSSGALVALANQHILMAPGSSIGAAEPISSNKKEVAAWKDEFVKTAEDTGHNPAVAAAMVDKTNGYPDFAEPGKVLVLSDSQAKELNISTDSADSLADALALYDLGEARINYVEKDWRDLAMSVLQNPYVQTLFVALIIAAILVEIKMAGMGVGVATAIVFAGLLLLAGEATLANDIKMVAAFLVSLLCIGLELAMPGVGIFGLAGVVLLYGSLFFMLGTNTEAVYILAGGTVLAVIFFILLARYLPQSRLLDKLMLKNRSTKEAGYTSQLDLSPYLYQRGKTITILRPVGTIRLGKNRVDAVSKGPFIDRNVEVRVVQVDGSRVVVEPEPKRYTKNKPHS